MFLRNVSKNICFIRYFNSFSSSQTAGEIRIGNILRNCFPKATKLVVTDVSGGCGSMYEIFIEDKIFQGKKTVIQHRLVNKALEDEIRKLHGLRIVTATPQKN